MNLYSGIAGIFFGVLNLLVGFMYTNVITPLNYIIGVACLIVGVLNLYRWHKR